MNPPPLPKNDTTSILILGIVGCAVWGISLLGWAGIPVSSIGLASLPVSLVGVFESNMVRKYFPSRIATIAFVLNIIGCILGILPYLSAGNTILLPLIMRK